jgi:hypothetical protein
MDSQRIQNCPILAWKWLNQKAATMTVSGVKLNAGVFALMIIAEESYKVSKFSNQQGTLGFFKFFSYLIFLYFWACLVELILTALFVSRSEFFAKSY